MGALLSCILDKVNSTNVNSINPETGKKYKFYLKRNNILMNIYLQDSKSQDILPVDHLDLYGDLHGGHLDSLLQARNNCIGYYDGRCLENCYESK